MFFLGRGRRGRPPPEASTPRPPTTWTLHRITMALQHQDPYGAPPTPPHLPSSAPTGAFRKPKKKLAPPVLHRPSTSTTGPPPLPSSALTEAFRKPKAALAPPVLHRPSTATPASPHLPLSAPMEAFTKPKAALAPPVLHRPSTATPAPPHLPPSAPTEAFWKPKRELAPPPSQCVHHSPPRSSPPPTSSPSASGGRNKMLHETGAAGATALHLPPGLPRPARTGPGDVGNKTTFRANDYLGYLLVDTHLYRHHLKYDAAGREKNGAPSVGQWNKVNKEKINGEPIGNWTCLNFSSMCTEEVKKFCMDIVHICNDTGMFGGDKTELKRAFTRNATVISEAPTIFSGADVAHYPPGGDISSPSADVTVCFCDYEVPMPIHPGTTTVLQLVKSALMKLKIRASDFSLRFNGRTLDGSLMVNSIPALKGSKILVYLRMRGGNPVKYPLRYEQLDTIIDKNSTKLLRSVRIPEDMILPAKAVTVKFLDVLPQYILSQLLVMVCCEGHLDSKCYYGRFNLSNVLMSRCGHMRFSSQVRSQKYTEEGAEADYQQLVVIVLTFLDKGAQRYPLYVENLVWVLINAPPSLRKEKKFVAFIINHPCLLAFAERIMQYNVVEAFVYKLLNSPSPSADINALDTWLLTAGKGWDVIVQSMVTTAFYERYTHKAKPGTLAVWYQPRLDHGFRLGRNYLGHTDALVCLEHAEAALSYVLEFILVDMLYNLSRLLTGSNATDFISLISDHRADRGTVRPFFHWPESANCGQCGELLTRCLHCEELARCLHCGAQSSRCPHCGE